mgnify:CR=1 FL=1
MSGEKMRNLCYLMLICVLFSSCSKRNPSLTIVTEEYPPLSYTENDSVKGYGTEIVQLIQRRIEDNAKINVMKWNEAYQLALSKPNIVIYTIEKTKEREGLFYWIGPIGSNETSVFIPRKKNIRINQFDDLKKFSSIATTTDWFTEEYLKIKGLNNLTSMPNPEDNVKMVMKGKSDATILTNVTYADIVKNAGYQVDDLKPVFHVMSSDFYIGISKLTDFKIVKKWKDAYDQMNQEGIIDSLQYKWKIK